MIKTSIFISRLSVLILAISSAAFGQAVTGRPAPTPTTPPVPAATPTPFVRPGNVPSLADLTARIAGRLAAPEIRRGRVGIKIASLASGKVIFEQDAEKYFMPASNMKSFTVSTAMERLSPDFRFVTSIFAPAALSSDGVIRGDLTIFGRGDVSISGRFNGDDAFKGIDALADRIIQAGVKKIEGDIVGDDSYFRGFPIPLGWEWDDLQWSYGAEVSSLPLNDSVIQLSVKPGPTGYTCTVKLTPYNTLFRVSNQCMTGAAGTPNTLGVHKRLDQNVLEITGSLPQGSNGFTDEISVSRPAELFASMLKQRLAEKGVEVSGNGRYVHRTDGSMPSGVEIAKLESVPLSVIAANTMKPSQNMYTETLLWTLGEFARAKQVPPLSADQANKDSSELGLAEVKSFLTSIGIAPDGIVQYDGSGLSRHDLITPAAVVQLYTYMAKQSRYSQAWRDSLTIGGVDGTLRNRFRGTRAAGNVRGKTGTIDQVSALCGYVRTAAGEELVFSMVVNGVPDGRTRTGLMDPIVVDLANFTGRIDVTPDQ